MRQRLPVAFASRRASAYSAKSSGPSRRAVLSKPAGERRWRSLPLVHSLEHVLQARQRIAQRICFLRMLPRTLVIARVVVGEAQVVMNVRIVGGELVRGFEL